MVDEALRQSDLVSQVESLVVRVAALETTLRRINSHRQHSLKQLSATEKMLLNAANESEPLTGEELVKKLHIYMTSHVRTGLSTLVKLGHLGKTTRGYVRLSQSSHDICQENCQVRLRCKPDENVPNQSR